MSRFDYVKYDEKSIQLQNTVKGNIEHLCLIVENDIPKGRAQALAITKLEECYMWIGKAIRDEQIARNGSAELQEERKNG